MLTVKTYEPITTRFPPPPPRAERDNDGPLIIGVAVDQYLREVFFGTIEYADGGYIGIRRDDTGEIAEWPMDLVRLETAE